MHLILFFAIKYWKCAKKVLDPIFTNTFVSYGLTIFFHERCMYGRIAYPKLETIFAGEQRFYFWSISSKLAANIKNMLRTLLVENFILNKKGLLYLWRRMNRYPIFCDDKDASSMRALRCQLTARTLLSPKKIARTKNMHTIIFYKESFDLQKRSLSKIRFDESSAS